MNEFEGRRLLSAVAAETGFTVEQLVGKGKTRGLVEARRKVILALTGLGWSSVRIGKLLGRDHTTILWALERTARTIARAQARAAKAKEGRAA